MAENIRLTPTTLTSSGSPESPLAGVEGLAVNVPLPLSPESNWGENEDQVLQRGDETALKELESRMGKVFVRRRMQESLSNLCNYT